jgi:trans-L-3-hydroxyproline dehydratase
VLNWNLDDAPGLRERMDVLRTIDAHTGGEPLRILIQGTPPIPGGSILARRQWAQEKLEKLRRTVRWEPRGLADMDGAIPLPPATEDGDLGVLFMHNEGWSTMCGHGIIALVTVGVELGAIVPRAKNGWIRIDTPAGRVEARAHPHPDDARRVQAVSFRNVPSFVLRRDFEVEVPGLGRVHGDLAFGGAFYAFVDADSLGLPLGPEHAARILDAGRRIKQAVAAAVPIEHPDGEADLEFLYGTIFCSARTPPVHSRHACVFAESELDRSPTGTGVSARAAILHARGVLAIGQSVRIESLLGSSFEVEILETAQAGDLPAVVPQVTGSAHLTGRHEFWIDRDDPLGAGFLFGR